ncbi:MAG: HK97 gp10 family phage protein [Planctomycetota bacterium]|jgi:hypothetical protein
MATKTIKGMDELVRKLDTFAKLKGAKRGLKAGAEHIEGVMKEYAPKSQANVPKAHGRWYERGWGSKYRRLDGRVTGKKTSEVLRARWSTRSRNAGLTRVVGNNASYAKYVHDAEEQAGFHGDRGWKTDEQVLKSEGDEVLQFIQREVEKELAR